MRVVIVTPVFDDWVSFQQLVAEVDRHLAAQPRFSGMEFGVLAVDDGSIDEGPGPSAHWNRLSRISRVDVLRMVMNLGHQRAIAVGAVHVANAGLADAIVVMDADGEDTPADVIRLLDANIQTPEAIVLAQRAKRSESVGFRAGYRVYRWIYRRLTGHDLAFGNFSLVPGRALARLVCSSEIWNHFPAAVSRSRLPVVMVPTARGKRYSGQSRMNWVSLVIHGLSAMSAHADRIAARLILASVSIMMLSIFAIIAVVAIRFLTDLAVPGWASQVVGTFALASLMSVGFAALLAFITLQARQAVTFNPKIDAPRYIRNIESWHQTTVTTTSATN